MYAALHNAIKQTNSSIASMHAELLTIKECANRALEAATRTRDCEEDMASLTAWLEERANDMRSQLESLSHSQSSRLRELAESVAVTTSDRDTEFNHIKERIGRCPKAAFEIRKECTDRVGEGTGFEARLEEQMDALRDRLELFSAQNNSHARRLQELSRSVRVLTESLRDKNLQRAKAERAPMVAHAIPAAVKPSRQCGRRAFESFGSNSIVLMLHSCACCLYITIHGGCMVSENERNACLIESSLTQTI